MNIAKDNPILLFFPQVGKDDRLKIKVSENKTNFST